MIHGFTGFRSRVSKQGNEEAVDRSVLWMTLLDDYIAAVVTYLTEKEKRNGHFQKL